MRTSRGSSLVELLVAVSVLAVALVASAVGVLESSELERANAQTRALGPVLASLLDEVRATPFDEIETTWSGRSREVPGIPGSPTPAVATWTISDVAGSDSRWIVRRAGVELRWAGAHGPQQAAAVTFVSDRTIGAPPPGEEVPAETTE